MSTFDLTDEEIETIRNSIEPDHVLAGRYCIGLALVNMIRPGRRYAEAHGYSGKTSRQLAYGALQNPSLTRSMNWHRRSRSSGHPIELDFRSLFHGSSESNVGSN